MTVFFKTPKTISIHALREERDERRHVVARFEFNFNPRAPRGARPVYLA